MDTILGKTLSRIAPVLDKSMRSSFTLCVRFPVQQNLLSIFKLPNFLPNRLYFILGFFHRHPPITQSNFFSK